jgi:hypothetical protein
MSWEYMEIPPFEDAEGNVLPGSVGRYFLMWEGMNSLTITETYDVATGLTIEDKGSPNYLFEPAANFEIRLAKKYRDWLDEFLPGEWKYDPGMIAIEFTSKAGATMFRTAW